MIPSSGALLGLGDVSVTAKGSHYENPGNCFDQGALVDFDMDSTSGAGQIRVVGSLRGCGGLTATFDDCGVVSANVYECGDESIVGIDPAAGDYDIDAGHYLFLAIGDTPNGGDDVRLTYLTSDGTTTQKVFIGADSQDRLAATIAFDCVLGFVSNCDIFEPAVVL